MGFLSIRVKFGKFSNRVSDFSTFKRWWIVMWMINPWNMKCILINLFIGSLYVFIKQTLFCFYVFLSDKSAINKKLKAVKLEIRPIKSLQLKTSLNLFTLISSSGYRTQKNIQDFPFYAQYAQFNIT